MDLEDVVRMMEDPNEPGKYHSLIITLLNAEILDRDPCAAGFGNRPHPVTTAEFSDLKINVMQKLLARVRSSGGAAVV